MSNLDCRVRESPNDSHGHSHPYAHILLSPNEPLLVRFDQEEVFITPQQLGFVAPDQFHHCLCRSEIITINIPASMIKRADLEILQSHPSLSLTGSLIPLVDIIKEEIERNPNGDSIRYLFYYLYDKLVETNGIKSLRYIREHFSEEISVADLARIENYNISYFTDWFKRQTGWSPSVYLRNVRIEKAKELLASTHYRMVEIAVQVGYNSNAAFTRAFKESVGISPVAYRQQLRKNAPGE